MQGYVVTPPVINDFINNCPKMLAEHFAGLLDLQIISTTEFTIDQVKPEQIVISMAIPSQTFSGEWDKLPSRTRFVYWMDDGQWRTEERRQSMQRTLQRADAIIYCNKSQFQSLWGEHDQRAYWLPLFATPEFELPFNPTPEMTCSMSGNSKQYWYPIRYKVATSGSPRVDILEHPGYINRKHNIIGTAYAEWLHRYFCGVTDSSNNWATLKYHAGEPGQFSDEYVQQFFSDDTMNRGQVLKKYFEIPMTGSLLLADANTPEMYTLGFDESTFVAVTESDVLDRIEDVLMNPETYQSIRANGYAMVRQRHTWEVRSQEASKLIADLFQI